MKIDIPKVLLDLRSEVKKAEAREEREPPGEAGLSRFRLADARIPGSTRWRGRWPRRRAFRTRRLDPLVPGLMSCLR